MKSMKFVIVVLISLFIGGCITMPSMEEIRDREIIGA